jgi:hypothetical protein
MVNTTLLPPGWPPLKHLTHSKIDVFSIGTAFAVLIANRGLGELAARSDPKLKAWEGGRLRGQFKGRTTDGECASHRTITAADAGTTDGCRRQ